MPYVETNGINLYYERRGKGLPLILLMGLGSDHTGWDKHVVDFEKHFECILIDNRGCGQSDKPPGPYTTSVMAEDVIGCMDALGIESAYINGCSMGGAIAQQVARKAPERVKKVVLTASFAKLDQYGRRITDVFQEVFTNTNGKTFQALADVVIFSREYFETNLEQILQGEEIDEAKRMPAHAYRAQAHAVRTHDATSWLHELQMPCLIYAGGKDLFSPYQHAQWMEKALPNGTLEVEHEKGHAFHLECAQQYNQTVINFLQQNN